MFYPLVSCFLVLSFEHPPSKPIPCADYSLGSSLRQAEGVQVTDLKKCDFSSIAHYYDEEKAKTKQLTAAEKKE
jgi:hypothetical protein